MKSLEEIRENNGMVYVPLRKIEGLEADVAKYKARLKRIAEIACAPEGMGEERAIDVVDAVAKLNEIAIETGERKS